MAYANNEEGPVGIVWVDTVTGDAQFSQEHDPLCFGIETWIPRIWVTKDGVVCCVNGERWAVEDRGPNPNVLMYYDMDHDYGSYSILGPEDTSNVYNAIGPQIYFYNNGVLEEPIYYNRGLEFRSGSMIRLTAPPYVYSKYGTTDNPVVVPYLIEPDNTGFLRTEVYIQKFTYGSTTTNLVLKTPGIELYMKPDEKWYVHDEATDSYVFISDKSIMHVVGKIKDGHQQLWIDSELKYESHRPVTMPMQCNIFMNALTNSDFGFDEMRIYGLLVQDQQFLPAFKYTFDKGAVASKVYDLGTHALTLDLAANPVGSTDYSWGSGTLTTGVKFDGQTTWTGQTMHYSRMKARVRIDGGQQTGLPPTSYNILFALKGYNTYNHAELDTIAVVLNNVGDLEFVTITTPTNYTVPTKFVHCTVPKASIPTGFIDFDYHWKTSGNYTDISMNGVMLKKDINIWSNTEWTGNLFETFYVSVNEGVNAQPMDLTFTHFEIYGDINL